jgi:hypothetical protein
MMSSALRSSDRTSPWQQVAGQEVVDQAVRDQVVLDQDVAGQRVAPSRAGQRALRCACGATGWIAVIVSSAVIGCKSRAAVEEQAAPTTEPERFTFALPQSFVPVELRGEGSETLRAPAGARVTRTEAGFKVEAGPDFDLELVSHAPPLAELGASTGVARVLYESDLSMFKSEHGYSFVTVRELVPEWDESARQRFACGSAGGVVRGGSGEPSARGFSKAAAENMVASCRTLELPALE